MYKNDIKSKRSKRSKLKKRPWHWFLIVGISLLSYIFLFGNHGLIRYYQLQQRKKELVRQIAELKEEQVRLQNEIDMLQNNFRYIEKVAREKYQMGKDGEKIYFIIEPAGNDKKEK